MSSSRRKPVYPLVSKFVFLLCLHLFWFTIVCMSNLSSYDLRVTRLFKLHFGLLMKVRFYFGHVRTYSWLHKLRNTQGKIYGTYLGNIYGIYKEYKRNIHKYLWYNIIINTGAAFGGRPIGSVFLIILYHKYLLIFLIYSLYIPYIFPKYVPYIFPCVLLDLWSQQKISPYC